ncbi:DUF2024 family protein [Enterobacter asburiae]|uniref:DUF2024 family protein n=1 Tax=Enterobacter asburiae TaxID=61645 RepID=UPI002005B498|nr:DUF2024 family protein [Enterobacter asburiae]MCK7226325.1 DUF2024 family protein [Enterobacter asburiae]
MEAHVFDTHVQTRDGRYLHFDVLISRKDDVLALRYAREWLARNGIHEPEIAQNRCQFCHSELASQEMVSTMSVQGYFIIPMQGCDEFR